MKILLDECVSRKLKRLILAHEVFTVAELGFNGLKNGALLTQAVKDGFDILLTIDKNISSQQHIQDYEITLVIFDVYRSNLKYLEALIPTFEERISEFQKGQSYVIGSV